MLYLPHPRRFRRPLLFPPGLLALAWLLCLGCAALPQMRGAQNRYVLETFFFNPAICYTGIFPEHFPPCLTPAKLESFRKWNTIVFTGNVLADDLSIRLARFIISQVSADESHRLGLHVRFEQKAKYSNLVGMLDYLRQVNFKKYWVDTKHENVALYITTVADAPMTQVTIVPYPFICGTRDANLALLDKDDKLSTPCMQYPDWMLQLHGCMDDILLFSRDWRNSTLLVLLMGLLSLWQLRRRL